MEKSNPSSSQAHTTEQREQAIPNRELALATITKLHSDGRVDLRLEDGTLLEQAMTTVPLVPQDVGRQAALMHVQQDQGQAIVIGLIRSQLDAILDLIESSDGEEEAALEVEPEAIAPDQDVVSVDGKKLILEGKEEVVIKCGAASISLNKSGKIQIRGKYLLNRASGLNRIMGGSVQVN